MKKLFSLLLAVLCLLLAGCGSKTVESDVPEALKTVPTLTVRCGENSVEALQGPQEWWYDNGDGTKTSFIADSLHILACKDYMTPLTIVPSTYSAHLLQARLEFSEIPDSITVRSWSVDSFCGPGEPVDDGHYEVLVYTLEPESDTDDVRQFFIELPYEERVYEITAVWDSYERFGGEVRYGFYTETPFLRCTEELAAAPNQQKVQLGLRQFQLNEASYEGEEAETEEISVLLERLSLPETAMKSYENDDFLIPIATALENELGLILDGRWKFYIHYYTPEQDMGILAMTYWVDDIIATNRAVTIPIEKGNVQTIIYSYLDTQLDEQRLLEKQKQFQDTHEQERVNVLGEGFEIDGESTLFSYNFRTNLLKYTYNIFYRHIATGVIDNSYGTEMVIE